LISVAVSALQGMSGDYRLALLQPLRCFTWVALLAWIEIATVAIKVWKRDAPAAALLVVTIGLNRSGVLIWLPALLIAAAYIGLQLIGVGRDRMVIWLRGVSVVLFGACVVTFLLGRCLPFKSLQSPLAMILSATTAAVIFLFSGRARAPVQLGVASVFLGLCLAAGISETRIPKEENTDWVAMARWVGKNTRPNERVLTPPGEEGFRNLAYRSPVSEANGALWWVDPKLEALLEAREGSVRQICSRRACDCQGLAELARQWGAEYMIIKGTCEEYGKPIYRAGGYSLFTASATGR
jgi:hypothetical protein